MRTNTDGQIVMAGLERTDNNMDLTTWPVVSMINQKNYYTFVFPLDQCLELRFSRRLELLRRADLL